jgi:HEAT repeat protein
MYVFLLLAASAWASGPVEPAVLNALSQLRAEPSDLSVRPDRWDTRSKLPAVERLLDDPVSVPREAGAWLERLRKAEGAAEGTGLASELLLGGAVGTSSAAAGAAPLVPEGKLPKLLWAELERLADAVRRAQPLLDRAVASVPAERRPALLRQMGWEIDDDDAAREDAELFDTADRFDEAPLLEAARIVAEAAEAARPRLQAFARFGGATVRRTRLETAAGAIVVGGSGDDSYGPEELESAAVLVDLGGDNRYDGPAAAAGEGKIRIVIDLGRNVVVQSTGASAGSGTFGIGLLSLPNPEGIKLFRVGDGSLGAGLFGAGIASVAGRLDAEAGRFAMGAGAYGLGWFEGAGDGAKLTARLAAQGAGFTKGAGLFRLHGSRSRLECGLVEPDPREDLATIGLCQGTGFGARAFAAGGIGLAVVEGRGSELESGYFAQGSGYWHGLGGLEVVGDEAKLKARRYDMGAGIHTAIGFLDVRGDRGSIVNWGVGPAYGWDYGVGVFRLRGAENSVYGEWGTGHGDINGRAIALIRGNRNRLSLPDFGSGAFRRNEPSYGLALVAGAGNGYRFEALAGATTGTVRLSVDPYGLLDAGELRLDPKLELPKPEWRKVDRSEAVKRERSRLEARLAAADKLPPEEAYSEWLSVASNFGLDSQAPAKALDRLCSVPPTRAPELVRLLSSDRFDELVWLRPVLASHGDAASAAAAAEIASSSGTRKALLVDALQFGSPERALPPARAALADSDWRVRREAAAALGVLFDIERGEEPGRLALIDELRRVARKGAPKPGGSSEKALIAELGKVQLPLAYSVLALGPGLDAASRRSLFAKVGGPTDPLGLEAWREVFALTASRPKEYEKAFAAALAQAERLRTAAREAVLGALGDPDPEVAHAALISLGQLGGKEDAGRVASFLEDRHALLREAAAACLGKLGRAARGELKTALRSPSARTRGLAAVGAARSSDRGTLGLLARALDDQDEGVRRTAVSAVLSIPEPLRPVWKRLVKPLERLAAGDPSASVRAGAAYALQRVKSN